VNYVSALDPVLRSGFTSGRLPQTYIKFILTTCVDPDSIKISVLTQCARDERGFSLSPL